MTSLRLFERLTAENKDDNNRITEPGAEELVTSISLHLEKILNTRQGSVLINPGFGIPEFSNLPGNFISSGILDILEKIRITVKKFEPRLHNVKVYFLKKTKDDLTMRFSLYGTISHKKKQIPVNLLTTLDEDGRFDLTHVTDKIISPPTN